MRCKKHLSDLSSSVGVCASCLRDKLFILIEKQSESPIQFQSNSSIDPNPNPNPNFDRRKQQLQQLQQQQQPPPLIFPRSVSPYISRRKSEPIQRFYTTPLITINPPKKSQSSSGKSKFGLIAKLFRSRSTKSSANSTSDTNSTIISHNSTVITCRNKGMSPENELEDNTAESSPARWMNRPSPARVRPSPARAASIAFCLSPLVRASPSRHRRCEKSGFSGEIRVPASGNSEINSNKPPLVDAASFCANRSRKLADFGRLNHNH
ncbi:uncharacterized protein LOC141586793 [Silene latifolia]|uniref:uncharacterized protein LOC141586793 n=1 Tax=Silene latifolia TaxID=37657 RepID=UPI003D777A50